MLWSINIQVGRLLADKGICDALRSGGDEMQNGIMKRCLDYDRDYQLKRLGLNKDERTVGAIYIFSKEVRSPTYEVLENAVRTYAASIGAGAACAKIDKCLVWKDGRMYWSP